MELSRRIFNIFVAGCGWQLMDFTSKPEIVAEKVVIVQVREDILSTKRAPSGLILHIVLPYHSWKDFCIEHRAPAQQNEYCRLPGKEEVMGKSWNESMFNSQNCNYLKCVLFGSGPLVPNNFPLFGFGFPV
ncbi:hypothetical protein CUMW_030810 [Citrus unshiu]|nr:hypothetical protein CUMW_030810 [Citrus unshiu]